jgi:hypothetical protein
MFVLRMQLSAIRSKARPKDSQEADGELSS